MDKERKTRIICTIGPAVNTYDQLLALAKNGMNVARLNFSHGKYEQFAQVIADIRAVEANLERSIGILADIQGPKIRVGDLENDELELVNGETVWVRSDGKPGGLYGEQKIISCGYRDFVKDVGKGIKILLDDGLMAIESVGKSEDGLECKVIDGGLLKPNKGINVPDVAFSCPCITEKDYSDILFALEHGVDFIALSFVRTDQEVRHLKDFIQSRKKDVAIIAKIEKQDALRNLESIIDASDGILVARGDLAVEVGNELVPVLQKRIVNECNFRGKTVIVATQMLMSMVDNPRPSRAEASDVANAIVEGADAVMLSNETAVGKFPIEALQMMAKIALEMENEKIPDRILHHEWKLNKEDELAISVVQSAVRLSTVLKANLFVTLTQSGRTSLLVSKCRPDCPVVSITPRIEAYRQSSLQWGVTALPMQDMEGLMDQTSVFETVAQRLLALNICKPGDTIVITAGLPNLTKGSTNTIKVQKV